MHTNFHPAPGVGMFLPPTWTIPENPLKGYLGIGMGSMGEIVTGLYTLPSNPIVDELNAKIALAAQLQKYPVGLSCGPATCPCQVGLCGPTSAGMGGLTDDLTSSLNSLMSSVTGSMGNWQTWAMVGAGILALVMFTGGGGSQRSAELAAAKAQYKSKVAGIRAARPRRYQKFV